MIKKTIATILCTLTTLVSFADAAESTMLTNLSQIPADTKMPSVEQTELKHGILYVRFLAADPSVLTQYKVHPGGGIGYRRVQGSKAFDIFGTWGGRGGRHKDAFTWTCPKVSYLHYVSPYADQTLYLGAGLGFGGIDSKRKIEKELETTEVHNRFIGILGHVTAGVEWCRREACVIMSELSVSQPFVPANNPTEIMGPSADLSLGFGF
jgi:hypothetical protein